MRVGDALRGLPQADPARPARGPGGAEPRSRATNAQAKLGLITITQDTKVGWGPLLIVLYATSQLTSSYLMSQNMQPAQRAMLLILPIAFIPFVLNFPSGLMLYWLTTNLWTTGQGIVTRKLVPKKEPPPKKSSRTPPKAEAKPNGAKPAAKGAATTPAAAPRVRKVKRKKGGSRR